mmetsp:Transcript_1040/g.2038  ORF Transcript_1040/g.2038 Transcript_1040/m.2038 type:complete len:157 (+) Transcript_1040:317-787(+)
MQQSGNEGAPSSDHQYENGRNHVTMNDAANPQNSVLSALPPPMPSRKLGEQPPVGNNVESVINKAKKAATYLYTLLHAKNCRLSVERCSHQGCADAKLMYLHLKVSHARSSCCPTHGIHLILYVLFGLFFLFQSISNERLVGLKVFHVVQLDTKDV